MKRSALISQPLAMRTDRYIGMGLAHVNGHDAWRLICACIDGDLPLVESLLEGDPQLVNVQYWYETPLHFAAREGQIDVARIILNHGADPTTSCFGSDAWASLLEVARLRGHAGMVELLTSEMTQRFGYSPDFEPVAEAIRSYDIDELTQLLDERPGLLEASDGTGNGVVHWAAMTHQPQLIGWLRERGANLDRQRADGRTPMLLSVHGDYNFRWWRDVPEERRRTPREMVDTLLDAGATQPLSIAILRGELDVVASELDARPEAADTLDSGRTSPLCYASLGEQPRMTELLLAHGADPNQPEALAPHGRALYEASARNQLEQARLLLGAGADPDGAVDSSGNCLYIVATRHPEDCAAMQELLRSRGARKASWQMQPDELRAALQSDEPPPNGEDLWTDVLETGDTDLLDLLIKRHPDTPALLGGWAFRPGSPKLVGTNQALARLIDNGFDINRGDWQGATLLHYCAEFGNVEIAGELLRRGAEIDAVELTHGGTPLATAARCGSTEMVALLLAEGADPRAPAEHEWASPLAQARRAGHTDIADLLTGHAPG